jgi:hypothetical protein
VKIKFNLKLTKNQQKAYNVLKQGDTNILVCRWSRQCGKSVLAEILLIEYLSKPKLYSAYISPTFALGRKVFKEITQLLEGTGLVKSANASTLTIESITGSTLQFFSIEAYTAIRGHTISGIVVMDEAAFYPDILPSGEDIWGSVIMPITKARKPKILAISTPRGKRGMFYTFYQRAINNQRGYKQITASIYDDELITPEQIEEIKASVPARSFQEEFEVQFLDSSQTFFEGYEKCFKPITRQYQKTWIGIDLSGDGQDDTVLTKVNEKNEVECLTITGSLDMKYQKIAAIIDNSENLQGVYIEQNGIGAPIYNEIIKLVKNKNIVRPWTTTNSTKEEIVSALAVAITKQEIIFDANNDKLFQQMGVFTCKLSKTNKLIFGGQTGYHDDMVMSAAIAYRCKQDYKFDKNIYFNKRATISKLN